MYNIFKKAEFVLISSSILASSTCIAMEGGEVLAERFSPGQHYPTMKLPDTNNEGNQEQERALRLKMLMEEEKKSMIREQEIKMDVVNEEIGSLQKELEENNLKIKKISFQDDFIFPALQSKSEKYKKQIEELAVYSKSINEETTIRDIRSTIDGIRMRYSSIGLDYSYPVSLFS